MSIFCPATAFSILPIFKLNRVHSKNGFFYTPKMQLQHPFSVYKDSILTNGGIMQLHNCTW
jgi:hypothetical protein